MAILHEGIVAVQIQILRIRTLSQRTEGAQAYHQANQHAQDLLFHVSSLLFIFYPKAVLSADYPFTAPIRTPFTKNFCANGYIASIGKLAMKITAYFIDSAR